MKLGHYYPNCCKYFASSQEEVYIIQEYKIFTCNPIWKVYSNELAEAKAIITPLPIHQTGNNKIFLCRLCFEGLKNNLVDISVLYERSTLIQPNESIDEYYYRLTPIYLTDLAYTTTYMEILYDHLAKTKTLNKEFMLFRSRENLNFFKQKYQLSKDVVCLLLKEIKKQHEV